MQNLYMDLGLPVHSSHTLKSMTFAQNLHLPHLLLGHPDRAVRDRLLIIVEVALVALEHVFLVVDVEAHALEGRSTGNNVKCDVSAFTDLDDMRNRTWVHLIYFTAVDCWGSRRNILPLRSRSAPDLFPVFQLFIASRQETEDGTHAQSFRRGEKCTYNRGGTSPNTTRESRHLPPALQEHGNTDHPDPRTELQTKQRQTLSKYRRRRGNRHPCHRGPMRLRL